MGGDLGDHDCDDDQGFHDAQSGGEHQQQQQEAAGSDVSGSLAKEEEFYIAVDPVSTPIEVTGLECVISTFNEDGYSVVVSQPANTGIQTDEVVTYEQKIDGNHNGDGTNSLPPPTADDDAVGTPSAPHAMLHDDLIQWIQDYNFPEAVNKLCEQHQICTLTDLRQVSPSLLQTMANSLKGITKNKFKKAVEDGRSAMTVPVNYSPPPVAMGNDCYYGPNTVIDQHRYDHQLSSGVGQYGGNYAVDRSWEASANVDYPPSLPPTPVYSQASSFPSHTAYSFAPPSPPEDSLPSFQELLLQSEQDLTVNSLQEQFEYEMKALEAINKVLVNLQHDTGADRGGGMMMSPSAQIILKLSKDEHQQRARRMMHLLSEKSRDEAATEATDPSPAVSSPSFIRRPSLGRLAIKETPNVFSYPATTAPFASQAIAEPKRKRNLFDDSFRRADQGIHTDFLDQEQHQSADLHYGSAAVPATFSVPQETWQAFQHKLAGHAVQAQELRKMQQQLRTDFIGEVAQLGQGMYELSHFFFHLVATVRKLSVQTAIPIEANDSTNSGNLQGQEEMPMEIDGDDNDDV